MLLPINQPRSLLKTGTGRIVLFQVSRCRWRAASRAACGYDDSALILSPPGRQASSHEEAAAICATPVGTIKSRVHRARTRLSKLLSIDSADMFGQDNTTRAVLSGSGAG